MRIFILFNFAFCSTKAFVTPWARIQDMMENTVQGNIAAYIDNQVVGGIDFSHHLIVAKEVKTSQEMIQPQRQLLSKLELAIVRSCSSTSDEYLDRCFALNGFRAIGFSMRPCQKRK